jgi:hypothetical protein
MHNIANITSIGKTNSIDSFVFANFLVINPINIHSAITEIVIIPYMSLLPKKYSANLIAI